MNSMTITALYADKPMPNAERIYRRAVKNAGLRHVVEVHADAHDPKIITLDWSHSGRTTEIVLAMLLGGLVSREVEAEASGRRNEPLAISTH